MEATADRPTDLDGLISEFVGAGKVGRPTSEQAEVKEAWAEFQRFRAAKALGLFAFTPPDIADIRAFPSEKRPVSERIGTGLFSSLLTGDFEPLIEILDAEGEEAARLGIRYGAPALAVLLAMWFAEREIDGFPPVLHLSVSSLKLFARLLQLVGDFVKVAGGIVNDPIGGVGSALGETPLVKVLEFGWKTWSGIL